jgi:hypothetical protein
VIYPDIEQWKKKAPKVAPPSRWWKVLKWGKRASALGILVDGLLVPSNKYVVNDRIAGDATEGALISEAQNLLDKGVPRPEVYKWLDESIAQNRADKAKPKEETNAPPVPNARTKDNVSVKRDRKRPCRTVPDYSLRYGTRSEGVAGQKRIGGLPSFRDGPAICLQGYSAKAGDEHSIAHGADAAISALGGGSGMAPISKITAASALGALKARPECAKEIATALAAQPSLFGNTPARTTIAPPGKWPPK